MAYGKERPSALASSKRIAKIAFTGSTTVGSHIFGNARQNILFLLLLKLGGKSPNIYFLPDVMKARRRFYQ